MEKEVFDYLNKKLKIAKWNDMRFLECRASATGLESYHFVCGGVRGLIRYKFKDLTHEQIAEYHLKYHKMVLSKKRCRLFN